MKRRRTYPEEPIVLPVRLDPDPEPVPGCDVCADLARRRTRARAATPDPPVVTDLNIMIRRHPH